MHIKDGVNNLTRFIRPLRGWNVLYGETTWITKGGLWYLLCRGSTELQTAIRFLYVEGIPVFQFIAGRHSYLKLEALTDDETERVHWTSLQVKPTTHPVELERIRFILAEILEQSSKLDLFFKAFELAGLCEQIGRRQIVLDTLPLPEDVVLKEINDWERANPGKDFNVYEVDRFNKLAVRLHELGYRGEWKPTLGTLTIQELKRGLESKYPTDRETLEKALSELKY